MTTRTPTYSVLGLGAMGAALARALLDAGIAVTVWNRTPARTDPLGAAGATVAAAVADAVSASDVIVTCLFDAVSVHDVLDPVATKLGDRDLINVTTTTPNEARELATWAIGYGARYLDGGIMATPSMIGQSGAATLYSGDEQVFAERRDQLDAWAASSYLGTDAGAASLQDLALLAVMYAMFGGFVQGAAMVSTIGVPARDFAAAATPFVAAMTSGFGEFAAIIDAKAYDTSGQQSLEFSDLSKLVAATTEAGVDPIVISAVHTLIRRQLDAGHGNAGFARIYESVRAGSAA